MKHDTGNNSRKVPGYSLVDRGDNSLYSQPRRWTCGWKEGYFPGILHFTPPYRHTLEYSLWVDTDSHYRRVHAVYCEHVYRSLLACSSINFCCCCCSQKKWTSITIKDMVKQNIHRSLLRLQRKNIFKEFNRGIIKNREREKIAMIWEEKDQKPSRREIRRHAPRTILSMRKTYSEAVCCMTLTV